MQALDFLCFFIFKPLPASKFNTHRLLFVSCPAARTFSFNHVFLKRQNFPVHHCHATQARHIQTLFRLQPLKMFHVKHFQNKNKQNAKRSFKRQAKKLT